MTRWRWVVLWLVAMVPGLLVAQVVVVKTMNEMSLLRIADFKSDADGVAQVFRQTLEADLVRSEYFKIVADGSAEFALLGKVEQRGARLRARCEAYNAITRERHLQKTFEAPAQDARRLAHLAADEIVLALTGRRGMASSRFVMVGNRTGKKELYLCDADGQGLRQLTTDKTLSLFPKWGPDGNQIVYTSFRARFADIYLITLAGDSWQSRSIASFPGLNTCAALSPDGREVVMTLSKDGNPDLYIMDLASRRLTRLTSTPRAAEASPSWSPDGREIVFVSDLSGTPQLYITARSGGQPRRVTHTGVQNFNPTWGANGFIAYSSNVGSYFQIYILHPKTLESRQITREDANYEEPTWAPDQRHLACTRTERYRSRIFIIDMLTHSCLPLLPDSITGDWMSPSWSP